MYNVTMVDDSFGEESSSSTKLTDCYGKDLTKDASGPSLGTSKSNKKNRVNCRKCKENGAKNGVKRCKMNDQTPLSTPLGQTYCCCTRLTVLLLPRWFFPLVFRYSWTVSSIWFSRSKSCGGCYKGYITTRVVGHCCRRKIVVGVCVSFNCKLLSSDSILNVLWNDCNGYQWVQTEPKILWR